MCCSKKKNRLKGWTQNLKLWESSFKQIIFCQKLCYGKWSDQAGSPKQTTMILSWNVYSITFLTSLTFACLQLQHTHFIGNKKSYKSFQPFTAHCFVFVVVCLFWKNTFISFGVTLVESQNVIHRPQSSPGQPCTFSFCCFFYLLLLTLLESVVHEWD